MAPESNRTRREKSEQQCKEGSPNDFESKYDDTVKNVVQLETNDKDQRIHRICEPEVIQDLNRSESDSGVYENISQVGQFTAVNSTLQVEAMTAGNF